MAWLRLAVSFAALTDVIEDPGRNLLRVKGSERIIDYDACCMTLREGQANRFERLPPHFLRGEERALPV